MRASGARVLVTDAQDACGVAAIRCLGAAGYRVTGAALRSRGAGLWSRRCSARAVLPDPSDDLDGFAEALDRLLAAEPQDAILCGRDETVYAISARRDVIAGLPAGLPEHAIVERALDKAYLTSEAAKAGLPVPEQRACQNVDQALETAHEFGFPVLVKPVTIIIEGASGLDRRPSRWVTDDAELREACGSGRPSLIQRPVRGQVLSFGGVASPTGLLGVVVSRYLRTWPVNGGHSSYSETVEPPPGLVEQVAALVDAIGWTGVFELELIEDADGVLHALDFNPRPYGSIALARPAGAPLCTLWCDWLLEGKATRHDARPGEHFRFEEREALNLLARLHGRDLRGAAGILRPRRRTAHAASEITDPLPTLLGAAQLVKRVIAERPLWASS